MALKPWLWGEEENIVNEPRLEQSHLEIAALGENAQPSPLNLGTTPGDMVADFTPAEMRMLFEPRFRYGEAIKELSMELAGPRQFIHFDPKKSKAAIVTCGGLCPGINNVIRTSVFELMH